MNRRQKRQAARTGPTTSPQASGPVIPTESFFPEAGKPSTGTKPAKPALLVRAFAGIVLSRWVRRRVRHPAARAALALIAREVGRSDLAVELEN